MTKLENCLYRRMSIRKCSISISISEMSVLERCLYTEVSVLERCLYWRGVCIREISVLQRSLYWRDLCITEISVIERCLYKTGICIRDMTTDSHLLVPSHVPGNIIHLYQAVPEPEHLS